MVNTEEIEEAKETAKEVTEKVFEGFIYEPPPNKSKAGFPSDNLFLRMMNEQNESTNTFEFVGNCIAIILATTAVTVCFVLLLVIPIASIVIGTLYKGECQKEPFIPTYLIVFGSITVIDRLLDCGSQSGNSILYQCCRVICGSFLLGWFIAGNVWIFKAYEPNYTDPNSEFYCHKTLYLFAFWLIVGTYIGIACLCCCMCGIVVTTMALKTW